jgi:hypothetical protein
MDSKQIRARLIVAIAEAAADARAIDNVLEGYARSTRRQNRPNYALVRGQLADQLHDLLFHSVDRGGVSIQEGEKDSGDARRGHQMTFARLQHSENAAAHNCGNRRKAFRQ